MRNMVWLVSYPKSGNTWFRMFLANYLKNLPEPLPLEEIESTPIAGSAVDFEDIIALNPFELTPEEVDVYRPEMYRILSEELHERGKVGYKKTHDAYTRNKNGDPLFPEEISRCAVYFIRNPLDVCVSYANHNNSETVKTVTLLLNEDAAIAGKKAGQLRQILKSWESHVRSWKDQSAIPVHLIRYEDMLQKPVETFGSVIRFLGLDDDKQRLEKAILHSDFNTLKQMEDNHGFQEKMQRCQSFFWKGKIGNYRDYLSEEQIIRIVEYNQDIMKEFGYLNEQGLLMV